MINYVDLKFNIQDVVERAQELKDKGYIFIENALPSDYCDSIVQFIDEHLDEKDGEQEAGHLGTMRRIWSAENYADVLQDYKEKCSRILSGIFGVELEPQRILALRDKAVQFNTQEERHRFARGRWHYDSWNDQYKIFLFLKDVGPENGPFEFIPGTNGQFKKRLALKRPWWFFNPITHFTSTKRPYQSISDERVQSIIDRGYPTLPLLAKQGSMLVVNPSALIHRASPISAGSRYLAVAYF